MTARATLLLSSAFALVSPSVGEARECDSAPEVSGPPAAVAPPPEPDYRTTRHVDGYADAYLGIGHLAVEGSEHYYDWYRHVSLPLFRAPRGRPIGWLHDGWVERGYGREPFSLIGTTETGYEHATLVVLEETSGGWIRIRVAPDHDERAGTVWTHRCSLSLGAVSLSLRLWRDHFSSPDHSPLYFRKDVPHALRSGPGTHHARITWIGRDDEIEPVEIQGNWMRVKVYQPGKFYSGCSGNTQWDGREREGWVQWWDRRSGPWLYWFTRGC